MIPTISYSGVVGSLIVAVSGLVGRRTGQAALAVLALLVLLGWSAYAMGSYFTGLHAYLNDMVVQHPRR